MNRTFFRVFYADVRVPIQRVNYTEHKVNYRLSIDKGSFFVLRSSINDTYITMAQRLSVEEVCLSSINPKTQTENVVFLATSPPIRIAT